MTLLLSIISITMSLSLMISHYHNKSTTKSRSVVYFILVANELINIVLVLFQRVVYRRPLSNGTLPYNIFKSSAIFNKVVT